MEQSPSWEANIHLASQEIPNLLQNPKVHYCNHKSLPTVPIPSQMYPVHTFLPFFLKIHSNIIFPFKLHSSKWSLMFRQKWEKLQAIKIIWLTKYEQFKCFW
jgi:hypothetical protein